MSALLHQDSLMWSRVQTLIAIQGAALGGGYTARNDPVVSCGIISVGFVLTVLLAVLIHIDRQVRDGALSTAPVSHRAAVERDPWCVGLACLLFAVVTLLVSDVGLFTFVGRGHSEQQGDPWQQADWTILAVSGAVLAVPSLLYWAAHFRNGETTHHCTRRTTARGIPSGLRPYLGSRRKYSMARRGSSTGKGRAGRWEWAQLANAATCRFGQDGVLWTIIGFFWSTNAVLLVALLATGDFPKSKTVRILVCVVGLSISVVWMVMQAAALRRVKWYEEVIKRLERSLGLPPAMRLISGPDPEGGPGGSRRLPRARDIMPIAPGLAILAWVLGLAFASLKC